MNYKFLLPVAISILCSPICLSALAPEDCMRGDATPVFPKPQSSIERHQFAATSRTEACEKVWLKGGKYLEVTHTGCEFYTLVFHFESDQLLKRGVTSSIVLEEAAAELRILNKLHPTLPFRLHLAASTLENAGKRKGGVDLRAQISVDGDGVDFLQTRVWVERADRTGTLGILEVTLTKGPL